MATANLNSNDFFNSSNSNNKPNVLNSILAKNNSFDKAVVFTLIKKLFEKLLSDKKNNVDEYWKNFFLNHSSYETNNIIKFIDYNFYKNNDFYQKLIKKQQKHIELDDNDLKDFSKMYDEYLEKLKKNEISNLSKIMNNRKKIMNNRKKIMNNRKSISERINNVLSQSIKSEKVFEFLNNNSQKILQEILEKDLDFKGEKFSIFLRIYALRKDIRKEIVIDELSNNKFDFGLLYKIINDKQYAKNIQTILNNLTKPQFKKEVLIYKLFMEFVSILFKSEYILDSYYLSKYRGSGGSKTNKMKTKKKIIKK
jgi:hypothetical protein